MSANDDRANDGPAIPRTFTPIGREDVSDSSLMVGLMRSMHQEAIAERELARERHARLLERFERLAIDIETHFREQEVRLTALESRRRLGATRK